MQKNNWKIWNLEDSVNSLLPIRLIIRQLNRFSNFQNQKKENISSKKGAFFGILFVFLPCRLIRFQQQTIQNLNKLLNYEHIEKAIWWAKNY